MLVLENQLFSVFIITIRCTLFPELFARLATFKFLAIKIFLFDVANNHALDFSRWLAISL
jgi:hypothetical protein